MKRILSMLFALLLVWSMTVTASADETVVKTYVPKSHTVTVEVSGGSVLADGKICGDTVAVERQKAQTWWIVPDEGKTLSKLYYNGQDVTGQMKGGAFTAPPLREDADLKAEFVTAPKEKNGYDLNVTVINSGGKSVSGAAVNVGGHTGTTNKKGNLQIKDVPPGTYPVVITDPDGNVIGYGGIIIHKPGDGKLTVTTDEMGNAVITPGKDTKKINLTIQVGEDGITVKVIKDKTDKPAMTPKTGDNNRPWIWITLMSAAGAGLLICIVCDRSERERNVL